MVLDITDDSITLRLINVYHEVPNCGHGLRNLFQHDLDENIPMAILGNFNIHSYRWSINLHTPSTWTP